MKTNSRMAMRWSHVTKLLGGAELHETLVDLADGPLVDVMGAVVLKELMGSNQESPDPNDITGYEATVNKVHISDYVESTCHNDELLVQGVKYGQRLISRLRNMTQPFTVILSRDPESDEVTVRFFVRREYQSWGSASLDDYELEEVISWDSEVA